MSHADSLSRNVGSVIYKQNITEAREAQQNAAFCTSLNGDNEFYRSDSDVSYKIN